MGTADIESPISTNLLEIPVEKEKKKRSKRSPTPSKSKTTRDSSSMTPQRTGRSVTPFSLYLIRHSTDPSDPPKWRSITPFLERKDKEKTPFELGTDLKAQLIAHKMVFDRASVMDITDESNYEPGRFITSDAAVIDRASVMDISNVEVVYLIEEYDDQQDVVVDEELQVKDKKKSKRAKKLRTNESSEKAESIERERTPGVEKKSTKSKKKTEKKKKAIEESDNERSPTPPPSPPKLSLKLELGAGPKMNKKMFEAKAIPPEAKPPVKKIKQEVDKDKLQVENETVESNREAPVEKTIKKKRKSILSLAEGDTVSIKSGSKKKSIVSICESDIASIKSDATKKKSRSRKGSLASDTKSLKSRKSSIISATASITSANSSNSSEDSTEDPTELQSNATTENNNNSDNDAQNEENNIVEEVEEFVENEERTPTPPPQPQPPRRSPSPAFPAKQPESYYKKMTKEYGENFSNQIRMFNTMKRDKPHHPAFIVTLKDLCVTETDNIEIKCAIYGPDISYKWLKDGLLLEPSERVQFIENENILALRILDSRPRDTADYTLRVYNEFKKIECVSYVNVAEMGGYQDEPCAAYIESMEDHFHFLDDKLMIECKIKGIPRPQLRWYKEDMQIHEWMVQYSVIEEAHGRYILVVNHPTEHDIGIYTLEVTNDRGSHVRKHCVQFLARRPTTSSKLNYRAYRFLC